MTKPQTTLEAMEKYTSHLPSCSVISYKSEYCDCGLSHALSSLSKMMISLEQANASQQQTLNVMAKRLSEVLP